MRHHARSKDHTATLSYVPCSFCIPKHIAMSVFFLAGAGTSAGRQGAKLGLYCSARGRSCLCQPFLSSFHSFNFVSRFCDTGSGCVVARGQNGFLYRVGFWGPSRWSSAVRSLWAALACPIFVYLYIYIYILRLQVNASSVSKRVNPNLAPKPLVLCWGHASVWMCCYNSDVKRGSVSPSLFGMRFWADCFPRCPWPVLLLCLLGLFQLWSHRKCH